MVSPRQFYEHSIPPLRSGLARWFLLACCWRLQQPLVLCFFPRIFSRCSAGRLRCGCCRMGITGVTVFCPVHVRTLSNFSHTQLLPCLKSITTNVNVREYEGKRVAVDAYCWLHKGAYACSFELCQSIPTDKYIKYCLHRVKMLQHNNITPVLVFDGGPLPNKRIQEEKRRAYG